MASPILAPSVALDPENTDTGAMECLFLLEATTPGMTGYVAAENLRAMRLMRQTIANRLKFLAEYNARGATTETEIVELGDQFAGFGSYPALDADMTYNLVLFLRIANNPQDRRQAIYSQFVRDALTAAKEATQPPVADYAHVTAWRTANTASPGPRFRRLTTLSGNDFHATTPVPPMPPHHTKHRSRHWRPAPIGF